VRFLFHSVRRAALSENLAARESDTLPRESGNRGGEGEAGGGGVKIAGFAAAASGGRAWMPRRGHVAASSASASIWYIRRREWLAFVPPPARRAPCIALHQSRRDARARVWVNRERRRTRRTVLLSLLSRGPAAHSLGVHFARWMSLRRSLARVGPFPRLLAAPATSSAVSFADRGRDRDRGGEKERGRRGKERLSASASEASKEERASEETRTGGGGDGGGGKEDYYYSWDPPHHTACRRDASP